MEQTRKNNAWSDNGIDVEEKSTIKSRVTLLLSKLVTHIFLKKRTTPESDSLRQLETEKTNPQVNINELRKLAFDRDESFYTNFNIAFPDFDDKLIRINPLIKISDIEFCALIKLKIGTKQIASIKNISVKAVENKKYRLRKKLNIATNQDIYIWMQKL